MNTKEIFGDLTEYECWTNYRIQKGDYVSLVNKNCEFEYDNLTGQFNGQTNNCFICKLELVETDYSGYVPEKSNNGGAYAFATAKVVKVY